MSQKKQTTESAEAIASALKPNQPAMQGKYHWLRISLICLHWLHYVVDQEQEMLDEEAANQQRLCAITIIDLNNKEINLKVSLEPLTSNPRA